MTRALIIAAHADDESIFCGNLMLAYPHWAWEWISVCTEQGTEREQHLFDAAKAFASRGVNIQMTTALGMGDVSLIPPDGWTEKIYAALLYPRTFPDIVFTHNRRGDYGHPHHLAVNYAARWMYENVWEFLPDFEQGVGPQWSGNVSYHFDQRPAKEEILREAYFEEMKAIARDKPPLYTWAYRGREAFTKEHISIDHSDGWPELP